MKKITNFMRSQILLFTLLFSLTLYAQVGIGNTDPSTPLDIEGAVSLREGANLTLSNGDNDDIVLPLTAGTVHSNYQITGPTAFFSIRSIVPVTASDGQIVILQNATTQTMAIRHDAGPTMSNNIYIPTELDLFLVGRYTSVTLMYDASHSRWVVQDKLSDESIWYFPPIDIDRNTTYNLTAIIPNCTRFSSVSVNLSGDWSLATQPTDEITIHHVEARTGEVRFVVSNNTSNPGGVNYVGMDFMISVRN